jgi:2-polyprenyl-3-methyl-5-hydroxy-6-metoxy-1,4-benzoquinol methylase
MATKQQISQFLQQQELDASWVDRLKVAYRPLISPLDKLLDLVAPGEAVMDIGCGSGQFALLVAEYTKAASVDGIEISETLIRNATVLLAPYQAKLRCQFSVYDGQVFPPALGQADVVFLIDVLHHVPQKLQKTFLANIHQGMKPGARLVLKDIDAGSGFVWFNKMHDLVFSEVGHERSLAVAKAWLTESGFKIVSQGQERIYVYPHYTLIAQK